MNQATNQTANQATNQTPDQMPEFPFVSFDELISNATNYNGTNVCVEGDYTVGFETSALSGQIWVDGKLTTSGLTCEGAGRVQQCNGNAVVCGKFDSGGKFGHLGRYGFQITNATMAIITEDAVEIKTDKTELVEGEKVQILIVNNLDTGIWYYAACMGLPLDAERLKDGEWERINIRNRYPCEPAVLKLSPGEMLPLAWNLTFFSPGEKFAGAGVYRLAFGFYKDEPGKGNCSIPRANCTAEEFKVYSEQFEIGADTRPQCSTDSDCVPAQCCHPYSCVKKENAPNCAGIACTARCEPPIDCGIGRCACVNGTCAVRLIPPPLP